MSVNFAPYQDESPETVRALSPPPPTSPRRSFSPNPPSQAARNIGTAAVTSPTIRSPTLQSQRHDAATLGAEQEESSVPRWAPRGASGGWGGGREEVDMFSTRLGIRMDFEACLAYLLLPPAGGVLLLVLEHRSDYVRFHAWQSSLLFTLIFVIHIIFSFSAVISWMLFAADIIIIGWLTFRAYQDAATLDRYEVPFFGPLASSILDDE